MNSSTNSIKLRESLNEILDQFLEEFPDEEMSEVRVSSLLTWLNGKIEHEIKIKDLQESKEFKNSQEEKEKRKILKFQNLLKDLRQDKKIDKLDYFFKVVKNYYFLSPKSKKVEILKYDTADGKVVIGILNRKYVQQEIKVISHLVFIDFYEMTSERVRVN